MKNNFINYFILYLIFFHITIFKIYKISNNKFFLSSFKYKKLFYFIYFF